MDPLGKKELLDFFDRHLKDFGDTPQAVRWTPEGQLRRYETLLQISGDISQKTILDFGCGKGDFYGFLKGRGIQTDYCGIDINNRLIELAVHKYPEAEFIATDIDEVRFEREFDVVFICGVFNLRVAGIKESMQEELKKLFRISREALHVNLLTFYTPSRSVELFYVKPEKILEFAVRELSASVTLIHSCEDIFLSVYHS
ncbi:MAG: class I SAM-dependent methyltransferase [Nitrospirota bacterium]